MRSSGGFICFLVASIALAVAAEDPPEFARYQAILDRQPFGAPPPAPAVGTETPADSPLSSLRVSAIIESLSGVRRVGLVDERSGRSYFLAPGESDDGLELISIQFEEETATLRWQGQTATLRLQGGPSSPAAPGARGGVVIPGRAIPGAGQPTVGAGNLELMRQRGPPFRRRPPQTMPQTPEQGTAGAPAAPPRPSPEEVERQLQQMQMDAIRRGLPPLPIPLTPEMDEQLVREGVLPPQ